MNRGQRCTYIDLVRLKWTRGDWHQWCSGRAGSELACARGQCAEAVHRECSGTECGAGCFVLVAVTANFAGRKLLAKLAFFFQGCVGIGHLLLPELGRTTYVQQGSVASCRLVAAVSMQFDWKLQPLRSELCFSVLCSASECCSLPTHSSAAVLRAASLIGFACTWRMREKAKKRLKDFVEELVKVVQNPAAQVDLSRDQKRGLRGNPVYAFNEEVRGLE